jgi:hypothetical protein
VVTSHRGTVEAVGHPGLGARFKLRLPETTVTEVVAAGQEVAMP